MSSAFSRVLRQGSVYAFGNFAIKASGLFLVPLYLNPAFLTPTEFAWYGLIEATAMIALAVTTLGINSGMLKFMAEPDQSGLRASIPFTALVATAGSATFVAAMLWLFSPQIADALFGSSSRALFIKLLGLYVALKVIGGIPLTMARVKERAVLYVTATLGEASVMVGAAYYFLVVSQAGLEGLMLALVVSSGVSTVVLTTGMLGRVAWSVRRELVGRLIRFGAPLVLSGLALPFLHAGDRFLLDWLAGAGELAVYLAAAKYAGVLNMLLVQSFQLAFSVIGLKSLAAEEEAVSLHRRTFRHLVVFGCWAALGLSLATYDFTALISPERAYLEADRMILPLSLGYVFYGVTLVTSNVLVLRERTRTIATSVFFAAALNVLLNVALIPLAGGLGASIATMLSYAVLAGIVARIAHGLIHIDYPWRALLICLLITSALYLIGSVSLAWDVLPRIAFRAALLLAFPVLVLVSGTYSFDDIRLLWQRVVKR